VAARVRRVLADQEAAGVDAAALDTVDARPVALSDGASFALKAGFHAGRVMTIVAGAGALLLLAASLGVRL